MQFPSSFARRCAGAALAGAIALSLQPAHPGAEARVSSKPVARSTVEIDGFRLADDGRVAFVGKVRSPRAACERGRRVTLRQVDQGVSAGKDRSSRQGRWRITFKRDRVEPGTFRAKVVRKVVVVDGRRVVCAADRAHYRFNGR